MAQRILGCLPSPVTETRRPSNYDDSGSERGIRAEFNPFETPGEQYVCCRAPLS